MVIRCYCQWFHCACAITGLTIISFLSNNARWDSNPRALDVIDFTYCHFDHCATGPGLKRKFLTKPFQDPFVVKPIVWKNEETGFEKDFKKCPWSDWSWFYNFHFSQENLFCAFFRNQDLLSGFKLDSFSWSDIHLTPRLRAGIWNSGSWHCLTDKSKCH